MPVEKDTLKTLIANNVDSNMSSISIPNVTNDGPLSQDNPSYFLALCQAVAYGIAAGTPITATTTDNGIKGAPPITGSGVGIGLNINAMFLEEQIYTRLRNKAIASFGTVTNPPYPPPKLNFLQALSKGIAEAIETHFKICWTYTTTHPDIYTGTAKVEKGNFSGLSASAISSAIQANGAGLSGSYWPTMCDEIAGAYVDTIHNESVNTSPITISGSCTPSSSQVCGLPGTGSGTGVVA